MAEQHRTLDDIRAKLSQPDRDKFERDLVVYGNAAVEVTLDGKIVYNSMDSFRGKVLGDK